jgi:hypothetical protein
MVGNGQSGEILRANSTGNISEPKVLGESLANKLITMGAKVLLENA